MSSTDTHSPPEQRADLANLRIDRGPGTRRRRRRLLGRIVLAAIVLGAIGVVLGPLRGTLFPTSVRTAPVTRVQATQGHLRTTASGYVVARKRAALSSRLSGRLETLLVDVGDRVEAGQLIGSLGQADLRAAVDEAAAALAQARAALPVLEKQIAAAEAAALSAAARAEEARSAEGTAAMQLAEAERVLALEERLVASGSSSPDEVAARRADRDIRRAEAVVVRAGSASADAEERRLRAEVDVLRARVASAEAAVAAAAAGHERTEAIRADADIRAPFAGVVLRKEAEVGEMVSPVNAAGSTTRGALVTLADFASLEMEVDVIERDIGKVAEGLPCRIVLDSSPQPHAGHVRQIVPTADRTRGTVQVKVTFDEPGTGVLPEMSGRVEFVDPDAADLVLGADRVLVDGRAVVTGPAGTYVWVVVDGIVTRTPVVVAEAADDDGRREVKDGLRGGEEVVLGPPSGLGDGVKVAVDAGGE